MLDPLFPQHFINAQCTATSKQGGYTQRLPIESSISFSKRYNPEKSIAKTGPIRSKLPRRAMDAKAHIADRVYLFQALENRAIKGFTSAIRVLFKMEASEYTADKGITPLSTRLMNQIYKYLATLLFVYYTARTIGGARYDCVSFIPSSSKANKQCALRLSRKLGLPLIELFKKRTQREIKDEFLTDPLAYFHARLNLTEDDLRRLFSCLRSLGTKPINFNDAKELCLAHFPHFRYARQCSLIAHLIILYAWAKRTDARDEKPFSINKASIHRNSKVHLKPRFFEVKNLGNLPTHANLIILDDNRNSGLTESVIMSQLDQKVKSQARVKELSVHWGFMLRLITNSSYT